MTEGSAKSRPKDDSTDDRRSESRPKASTASRAITAAGRQASTTGRSGDASRSRRAVTSADDPARDGVRLGVIAFTTAASFAGLLALGAIAGHVGADAWVGAGSMERTIGEYLVNGVRLPWAMLRTLYASGVDDPLFFALAMALLIPPIAALAAARPIRAGESRPTSAMVNAARLGAALIVAASTGVAIRLANVARPTIADVAPGDAWLDDLQGLAAADAISMAFAILLAVLVFRLPVDRWVRALAGTVAIATALAATVAAAASSGIAADVEQPRPIVRVESDGSSGERLLIGSTVDGSSVLLEPGAPATILIRPKAALTIAGRRSVVATLGTSR
jgi:hypothetical protein